MNWRYKVDVKGWGYTYCRNGIELDRLLENEVHTDKHYGTTITIETLQYKTDDICVRCGLPKGDHRNIDLACPHPRRFELHQPLYTENQFFKAQPHMRELSSV